MYKIGEFSRVCKTSIKTLRYYDDFGILKPSYIDAFSGFRYYCPKKIAEYNKIMILKEIGFSLDDIRDNFMDLSYENALLLLESKRLEVLNAIYESQTRLKKLDTLIKLINDGEKNMDFNITIKKTDTLKLASIRGIYKNRQCINKTLGSILKSLDEYNIHHNNVPIIINYDIEYLKSNTDLAVGIQILNELPAMNGIKEITIHPYEYVASLVCKSSNDSRELAYSSLTYWLENNSYQIKGAFIEIYHDEETLEIIVPIHKYKNSTDYSEKVHLPDNTLCFENDERVIGKWDIIDILPSREQFSNKKVKYTGTKISSEIYFLPEGQVYWVWGWTKDYIIHYHGTSKVYNKYEIFYINGQAYMFVEMLIGNMSFSDMTPEVYVLKKSNSTHYTRKEIMIQDKIDYPFINDVHVLGNWVSFDCVPSIESFNPEQRQFSKDSSWLRKICFKENGELEQYYINDKVLASPAISWTKGLTLMHKSRLAPAYELHRVNGCDYLFVEWKNGDYIFGKRKPWYYVFSRED